MPTTLSNRRSAIHDKTFAPRMAKAAIDCKSPAGIEEIEATDESVSLLLEVLDDLHVTPKEACDWMGIDRSKYTRFKTGEARPTFAEVWGLPDRVWLELRSRIDAAKGLTTERADDIHAERIGELVTLLVRQRRSA